MTAAEARRIVELAANMRSWDWTDVRAMARQALEAKPAPVLEGQLSLAELEAAP
jgi:hypothetical protein